MTTSSNPAPMAVGHVAGLLECSAAPPSPTLDTLPGDILQSIIKILYDEWLHNVHPKFRSYPRFDHERCQGEYLLGLSLTCRNLRAQTMPLIFREVYNWESSRGTVWPKSLWPYFKIVHIRDCTIRNPRKLALSLATIHSLAVMPSLTKATVRLDSSIPPALLHSLSLAPSLLRLEIHQARFDGDFPSSPLPFHALDTLLISSSGFRGVASQENVDHSKQATNAGSLLRALSCRLTELRISGEFIPRTFPSIEWLHLRRLAITEHEPSPYVSVPELVFNMPALRDLEVLYTVDMTRAAHMRGRFPSFHLGEQSGRLLSDRSPLLSRVTLGNTLPDDSIFAQLPACLESLRLLAPVDPYDAHMGFPRDAYCPFNEHTLPKALSHMQHLRDLTELCLDLDSFVKAPIIHHIGLILPQLEILEFRLPRYMFLDSPVCFNARDRDPAILLALNLFSRLFHLRITMHFQRMHSDPHHAREVTAQWFFRGVPTLQTVSYAMVGNIYTLGFDSGSWQTLDRKVLDLILPTPPPSPPPLQLSRTYPSVFPPD
ncbi:hypothetical protein R3P38DRAFT_3362817 [Favolaschia claudopus]|uniref:F-box domain-containing protein n=1 Tax=Favolaschia claudopus TaxID=2862362 RepID=A0AAW0AMW9_9AGAR